VDRRDCQIHDQIDVGHLQNRRQICGMRHPVLGRLRRRPTQVDIGARNDVDIWEADQVSQVLVADVTATDDGNSDWFKSIAHRFFRLGLAGKLLIGGECIRAKLLGNPSRGNFRGLEICGRLGHIDFDNDPTVK
jgi:hypothetical protein